MEIWNREPSPRHGHLIGVEDGRRTEDVKCWRRAIAGDQAAFSALYERYCDRLFNYALRRTASWEFAEDVVSTVFLEAWRHRRDVQFEDDRALAGWLFGVATNVLHNQDRTRRRHRAALARLRAMSPIPDLADHAADRIAGEQQAQELSQLVKRLPSREREALAMVAWAGLDYAEASIALGVPVGTVKSRVARARQRLRRLRCSDVSGRETVSLGAPPLAELEVSP